MMIIFLSLILEGLLEGMTVKKLITEHSIVARNPLIARVFYLSGLIEEYGSGIQRIVKSLMMLGWERCDYRMKLFTLSCIFISK